MSLEPSLLQTEQPQHSQPFYMEEVFQTSHPLCDPMLKLVQQTHGFPVLRTSELDSVLQEGSHKNREEENHLSGPAGHASFGAAWDTVVFLDC